MDIINIVGSTNIIRGGTNTGLYIFENKDALIIDPGLGGSRQVEIVRNLKNSNLNLKYIINTHEHEDHTGGNKYLKESFQDVKVFSTRRSKIYIENTDIYLDFITGGKRSHILENEIGKYIEGGQIVDHIIDSEREINLQGHKFKFIDISGHTDDGFAVITEDGVIFLADLLITRNSLEKFDFLFLSDCKKHLDSIRNLKNIEFEKAVLGHSKGIYNKNEIIEIAEYNIEHLNNMINCFKSIVKTSKTMDEIVREFSIKKNLPMSYIHYLEYRHSLNAVLSYLLEIGEVEYRIEDNIIKYIQKRDF